MDGLWLQDIESIVRGMSGTSPATEYEFKPVLERNKFANDQVHVTVMFETDEAFNDLDAIAATDGIDALTLGPTDLAQNLGVFGKPEMGKVLDERRDLILAAAKKHGKTCAMLVGSPSVSQNIWARVLS